MGFGVVFATCLLLVNYTFKNSSKTAVLATSTIYLLLISPRSDIRPEIFSMLFVSTFVMLLYLYRQKVTKKILLLVPLEFFWVNMHIYFFVGPLLVLIFLTEKIIEKRFDKKTKNLFVIFLGVIFITLFNPNGIKGALYPFFVLSNYGFPVVENQNSISLYSVYQNGGVFVPLIGIMLYILLLILGRKKARFVDLLLGLVFGVMALVNFRNILLFVFTTFIPFVSLLDCIIKKYSTRIKKIQKQISWYLYPLGIFILLVLIVKTISVHSVGFGVKDYGKNSVNFLLANKIEGPVFNDFNIGGYLSYRIYPQFVFVDNRPEAYPKKFFQDLYLPMFNNSKYFDTIDKKYLFNSIIISHWDGTATRNNLYTYLFDSRDYSLVYLDSYAFVMVRNIEKNKKIIDAYKITKQEITFSEIKNLEELVHYLFLFEKIGWGDKVRGVLSYLKIMDPQLCVLKNYTNFRKEIGRCSFY